jgi:uncharacterized membrane protein
MDAARLALLAFMLFHIAFITLLVNLLSCFENNRYRLPIDGFYVVLLAFCADRIWRKMADLPPPFLAGARP